jgi:hypothetical protein
MEPRSDVHVIIAWLPYRACRSCWQSPDQEATLQVVHGARPKLKPLNDRTPSRSPEQDMAWRQIELDL